VDDHCGYDLPWDPIPKIFTNNAKYHDVHHQIKGIKYNFSQPFFSFWDTICGTRWDTATKGSVYSVSVYKANEVCDDGAPVFKQD
jgi:sphinganine C4-monooxygenase